MGIDALHSALNGMRRFSTRVDNAAARIASVGLDDLDDGTGDVGPVEQLSAGATSDPLLGSMVDMMIAQRMFMANLRAAQVADEILEGATDLID